MYLNKININNSFYLSSMKNLSILFFMLIAISSCSSSIRFSSALNRNYEKSNSNISNNIDSSIAVGNIFYGKASYYGDEFHGRKTANGEIYDRNNLSAAHKSLPFGTILKVRNIMNNREVIVRINDRGPFVSGRIIDLSYQAAKELDMLREGVIDVEITILK